MLFRPQMWGFFFLNRERAFSFNWNLKWFALLLSGFLFFRIVARGNNFLALSGALILLFSSYIQWFFSTPNFHAGDDRDGVLRALGAAHNAWSRISMGTHG